MKTQAEEAATKCQVHDPEPQPTDGPDYHMEHAFWLARQARI